MKTISFIILVFLSNISSAQIKVTALTKTSIPKNITYTGQVKNAVQWTDSLGKNIIITTETGVTKSKNAEDSRDAALYALHYVALGDSMKLIWKFQDYVRDCPLDLEANYVANTFAVTDLDKNNKAEVWLMYKTSCKGDISPSDMKIIMYEAEKKYAVRGRSRIQISEKDYEGGEYKMDEAFKKTPVAFQQYAKQLWEKNKLVKY